jgi:hypothetical protein
MSNQGSWSIPKARIIPLLGTALLKGVVVPDMIPDLIDMLMFNLEAIFNGLVTPVDDGGPMSMQLGVGMVEGQVAKVASLRHGGSMGAIAEEEEESGTPPGANWPIELKDSRLTLAHASQPSILALSGDAEPGKARVVKQRSQVAMPSAAMSRATSKEHIHFLQTTVREMESLDHDIKSLQKGMQFLKTRSQSMGEMGALASETSATSGKEAKETAAGCLSLPDMSKMGERDSIGGKAANLTHTSSDATVDNNLVDVSLAALVPLPAEVDVGL